MPEQPGPRGTPTRSRKDEIIQELSSAFARDDLTIEEFERRLDVAHRTHDARELDALLADLPKPPPPMPVGTKPLPSRPPPPAPSEVQEQETIGAIMGGVERKGPWVPARRNNVFVFMGGVELDFREARMAAGVTEIAVFCAMGGVEILVPPGVAVEASGVPIMGGFVRHAGPPTGPDAPVLRVKGLVIMGGVDIQVRHAGESARDARRRERKEKKQRRNAE
jgi:uncharacterized protein DUF1707